MRHKINLVFEQLSLQKFVISHNIRKCIQETLKAEGIDVRCEINVLVTDDAGIQIINRESRNLDKPTDVLSFPALEDVDNITPADMDFSRGGEVFLGDVILCAELIKNQAPDFSHSFEEECVYMTVHSVLHLLGYDHMVDEEREEMFKIQDEIFKIIEEEEKNEK